MYRVGSVLRFLGLKVALAQELDEPMLRREAFMADVTYTTPATVAFAYLRDNNIAFDPDQLVSVAYFLLALGGLQEQSVGPVSRSAG